MQNDIARLTIVWRGRLEGGGQCGGFGQYVLIVARSVCTTQRFPLMEDTCAKCIFLVTVALRLAKQRSMEMTSAPVPVTSTGACGSSSSCEASSCCGEPAPCRVESLLEIFTKTSHGPDGHLMSREQFHLAMQQLEQMLWNGFQTSDGRHINVDEVSHFLVSSSTGKYMLQPASPPLSPGQHEKPFGLPEKEGVTAIEQSDWDAIAAFIESGVWYQVSTHVLHPEMRNVSRGQPNKRKKANNLQSRNIVPMLSSSAHHVTRRLDRTMWGCATRLKVYRHCCSDDWQHFSQDICPWVALHCALDILVALVVQDGRSCINRICILSILATS